MSTDMSMIGRPMVDPVSNVLKWILLVVAIACFAALGWMTDLTYKAAPPFPDRFVAPDGALLMSAADIQAGKAGFQKADLMDYGSLYGMGSYFGEDYTASNLVRLATLTEDNIAKARSGKALSELSAEDQAAVKAAMQAELQGVDLSQAGCDDPRRPGGGDRDAAHAKSHNPCFATTSPRAGRRPTASTSKARSRLPIS